MHKLALYFLLIASGLFMKNTEIQADSRMSYLEKYQTLVVPYIQTQAREGQFTGQNGVILRYRKVEVQNEKGVIVIAQGFGGSYLLHSEMQYDLAKAGYSVFEFDHRGQGLSDRVCADKSVGCIDSFDYLSEDLKTFIETVIPHSPSRKIFLIGHSMGGPVVANYMAENPSRIRAAVLAVPMMEVDVGNRTEAEALTVIQNKIDAGLELEYSWEEGPFVPKISNECRKARPTEGEGKLRGCMAEATFVAHPEAAVGGASWKWMQQSVLGSLRARTKSAKKISAPILMVTAEKDAIVMPGGQKEFCENSINCRHLKISGVGHGLLSSDDSYRDQFYKAVFQFFGE